MVYRCCGPAHQPLVLRLGRSRSDRSAVPQANAAGQLGQLSQRFSDEYSLVFATGRTDFLGHSSEVGKAQPIGLRRHGCYSFAQLVESANSLCILQMVHLLGESNHEGADIVFKIRILFEQRTNGFSSNFHRARIGRSGSQLNP